MLRSCSFLRERKFSVYTVPEAATMMFSNGAQQVRDAPHSAPTVVLAAAFSDAVRLGQFTSETTEKQCIEFQSALMRLQVTDLQHQATTTASSHAAPSRFSH